MTAMIDWMRYVHKGGTLEREERWLGRIGGHPRYVIKPREHEPEVWELINVLTKGVVMFAAGNLAVDGLKREADWHYTHPQEHRHDGSSRSLGRLDALLPREP